MTKPTVSDFHDDILSTRGGFLSLSSHGDVKHRYWLGCYVAPRGIVRVYRQPEYTRLDYVSCGRLHMRSWKRWWGDRTISRLAKQLIADVLAGGQQ